MHTVHNSLQGSIRHAAQGCHQAQVTPRCPYFLRMRVHNGKKHQTLALTVATQNWFASSGAALSHCKRVHTQRACVHQF